MSTKKHSKPTEKNSEKPIPETTNLNSNMSENSNLNQTPKSKNSKNFIYIGIGILVLILASGGGYYYNQTQNKNNSNNSSQANIPANGNRPGGRGGNFANFSFVTGDLLSIDGKTVIVDSSDKSGQKIIQLADTTNITKADTSDKSTVLKTDVNVIIKGTPDGNNFKADSMVLAQIPNIPSQDSSRSGNTSRPRNFSGGNPGGQGGPGANNPLSADPNLLRGKITSVSDNNFQVQVQGPNQKTITVDLQNSTVFGVQNKGSISDIKAGQKVQITGSLSGATINATNLTVL